MNYQVTLIQYATHKTDMQDHRYLEEGQQTERSQNEKVFKGFDNLGLG